MKDNKYEKILLTSAKLFSQKGAHGTSFQMIADEVGLDKSTLFHYFKSKEELVLRVLEKSVDTIDKDLEAIIANAELTPECKLK
ncbi:MAG: TetR/AcrR family transcriptional regulator, partial [Syntrophales bacterium]|nr:TetR/AcrR family transcriptional regulator [Syntrophales bacterium]